MSQRIIVVGGGLSGMSAAHTIVDNGGRVIVLDKSAFCGGNSSKATSGINAAGTSTQRELGIHDSPELFYKDTEVSAMEGARPNLIKTLTYESGPAVEWLKDSKNIDLSQIARLAAHSEPRTHRGKEHFPGMAITYGLMEQLDEVDDKIAQVVNKAQVTELIKEGEKVIGVVYTKGGKSYKEYGPVVICTGGFGADFTDNSLLSKVRPEWDKLHAWSTDSRAAKQSSGVKVPTPDLLTLPTSNGAHCTGDGVKLCVDAGSDTFDLHCVQVHPTGLVDLDEPEAKVKFLAAEALRGSGGLLLDKNGKRFCDELGKRDYVTGRMWLHNNGPYRLCLNKASAEKISWHCEHYLGRGLMAKMSGEELAKTVNCTPDELQKEFDIYNKAAENPGTDKFDTKFFESTPIKCRGEEYHVAIVCPVVHYCMGGVAGNEHAEVIRPDGSPIEGLYVAGEALGGVHGTNRLGGSSLLDCVVYGRVAGASSTKYLLNELLANGGGSSAGTSLAGINVSIQPDSKSVTVSWGANGGAAASPSGPPADDGAADVDPNQEFYGTGDKKGGSNDAPKKALTMEEIQDMGNDSNCIVVLHGKAYDVYDFLEDHPGGPKAIKLYKGKDASKEFDMLHKPEIIDKYASEYYIGDVAPSAKL